MEEIIKKVLTHIKPVEKSIRNTLKAIFLLYLKVYNDKNKHHIFN